MQFGEVVIVVIGFLVLFIAGYIVGKLVERQQWRGREKDIREDAVSRSRAVLRGSFSEQLAPYLPDFKYSPTEVRFVGKPIDFLVFQGLDEKEPSEVVFVEVKSGSSQLSTVERRLRDVINEKKVRWEEYRIP
jgi:predicted Holliday junction resolvase-like endonuclease